MGMGRQGDNQPQPRSKESCFPVISSTRPLRTWVIPPQHACLSIQRTGPPAWEAASQRWKIIFLDRYFSYGKEFSLWNVNHSPMKKKKSPFFSLQESFHVWRQISHIPCASSRINTLTPPYLRWFPALPPTISSLLFALESVTSL